MVEKYTNCFEDGVMTIALLFAEKEIGLCRIICKWLISYSNLGQSDSRAQTSIQTLYFLSSYKSVPYSCINCEARGSPSLGGAET